MSAYLYPQPLPKRRAGSKRRRIEDALLEELADGQLTTGRFLYYRLVAREVISKESKPDVQAVSEVLTDLRNAGVVPFEQIVDRTRSATRWATSTSADDAIQEALACFRIDPWDGRPRPQIVVESESLAGWLEPIAYRYAVTVIPLKGQSSYGLCWDAAGDLTEETPVFYLGDWDRGGRDIETSFTERVAAFARIRGFIDADKSGLRSSDIAGALADQDKVIRPADLNVRRLAVTEEQIERYDLTVIFQTDKRDGKASEAVQTEAMPKEVIGNLVVDALEDLGVDLAATGAETERQRSYWLQRLENGGPE